MAFKLGKQNRYDGSGNANTPKTPMEFGRAMLGATSGLSNANLHRDPTMSNDTLAEANNDGTISVNSNLDVRSALGKRVLRHEQKHMEDMASGRAAYDDKTITWEGNTWNRLNVNGKWGVMHEGKFKEDGDSTLPWEQSAIKAE